LNYMLIKMIITIFVKGFLFMDPIPIIIFPIDHPLLKS